VNEQLTELDHRVQRWVRVPRVCASICTSSGFLLAATLLRTSLAEPSVNPDVHGVDVAVLAAVNIAAIGLAGAAFCIALQMHARKAAASSAQAYDRLVALLEREDRGPALPGAVGAPR
jgi:ABC-type Fe3+-siderophore transport system permease subunit